MHWTQSLEVYMFPANLLHISLLWDLLKSTIRVPYDYPIHLQWFNSTSPQDCICDSWHKKNPGAVARERIFSAYSIIINDGQTHPMIIYAIMAWFWIHHESSIWRQHFVRLHMIMFSRLKMLPFSNWVHPAVRDLLWTLHHCPSSWVHTSLLPGVARLNLKSGTDRETFDQVVVNWTRFWTCLANFAVEEDYQKPHLNLLEVILWWTRAQSWSTPL